MCRWMIGGAWVLVCVVGCGARPVPLTWRTIAKQMDSLPEMEPTPTAVIEIRGASRTDTVRGVIEPAPILVGDSMIAGLILKSDIGRRFFRAIPRAGPPRFDDAPSDLGPYFTDISISPDARHVLYLAIDSIRFETAVVRPWPSGPVLLRSPSTPSCDCDVDMHHAHWVTADSFELATAVDTLRWERVSGSVARKRLRVDTIIGEPHWDRPQP